MPNGNDNYGVEVKGEYVKNFGIGWLKNLKLEVKKAYFRSMDNVLQKQKFRPTVSIELLKGLDCCLHYDYTGIEDISTGIDKPLSCTRTAFGEIHFYYPEKKWDALLNYTTAQNISISFGDYTSTRIVCGYHFTSLFFPYIGCEKIVDIVQNNYNIDCYFWTLRFNWTILPKYKTKTGLQIGYVTDNMLMSNSRLIYYGEFQQYFFDNLSISLTYGRLTSIELLPRFSAQVKYEF